MSKEIPILTKAVFFEASYEVGAEVAVSPRPFSSLSLRESGKISVTAEGKALFSKEGSLTFIPRGYGYRTQVLESGKMRILHFEIPPNGVDFAAKPLVATPSLPLSFQNLFANAVAHYAANGCDLSAMSTAYRLLAEAHAAFHPTCPAPPPRMQRAKTFLDTHFCDTALRISDAAALTEVSEVYFRREFQACYGISPLAYIKKRRIELAKQLLSTGLYSVTEVAMRSGFDSVSYFSAEFRRLVGSTPMAYRERYDK